MGLQVNGKSSEVFIYKDEADFLVAIENNVTRKRIHEKLDERKLSLARLRHPSVIIAMEVEIGIGTVIIAVVVINSSSRIGKGCIINTSSSLDHDNFIVDYVHISLGARTAGSVAIVTESWLGMGSIVSTNVKISSGCKIGAGAVVINDVAKSGIYAGVPVRKKE